jgi:pantothenate kinase
MKRPLMNQINMHSCKNNNQNIKDYLVGQKDYSNSPKGTYIVATASEPAVKQLVLSLGLPVLLPAKIGLNLQVLV